MDLVTKEEMKLIDSYTCNNITKSIDLMENAGFSIFNELIKDYSFKKVLLLCGSSGNGGDALVIGRYLLNEGYNVYAYLISSNLSLDCKTNKDKFNGCFVGEINNEYDLIIDGLIGFGLNSELRDNYKEVINKVNSFNKPIISIDIPTGIDASSGISYGAYIKADMCYTIEYAKVGLFLNDGLNSYKKLKIIPIGIKKTNNIIHLNEINDFKNRFRVRERNTNKGSFNKAGIVGGSYKYAGASYLSYMALSSLMMGIGYSYLYVPNSIYDSYLLKEPEILLGRLSSIDGHISYNEEELNKLLSLDSISIGMGMDISIDLYKSIEYLLKNYEKRLVIDADGINSLAKYGIDILKNKKCEVVLTPHLKEMERLTNISVEDIKKDSINVSRNFAKEYGINLILKSSSSIITDGNNIRVSSFGNTGLAKGGSGDILSGILSGLLAYLDLDTFTICNMAAYILGRSAEFAKMNLEEECILPRDIIMNINKVIKEIKYE